MARRRDANQQSDYVKYLKYNNTGFKVGPSDKHHVWWPTNPKESTSVAYTQVEVLKENDKEFTVQLEDGSQKTAANNEKNYLGVNPPKFDGAEDMGELGFLNEPAVLHNLKKRYASDLFHTYSGLFLVVVNPYKRLPIYTPEMVNLYRGKSRDKVAPHIFAMADEAYRAMLNDRRNQSMLITGESGAGKTENTKKVIQYLTAIAGRSGGDRVLEEQLLEFNPILEAFGNAKTTKNNNSSRFGKFIELQFNAGGQIAGANTLIYLLEKSRVVFQGKNERNFHVFYQILSKAFPAELKSRMHLTAPEDYHFLNQSGCTTVEHTDDGKEFEHSLKALDTLGVPEEDRQGVWETLSGILHLGNLPYTESAAEVSSLKDDTSLKLAAEHLGVDPAKFKQGLLAPTITVGQSGKEERVSRTLNKKKAEASRDALCKALYGRIFLWIVKKINDALSHPENRALFIGVLDISGFEIFKFNSFEQLCINYTNEKLQQFFNHHMFTLEQEEYEREKIDWVFVNYGLDLQDTIDLIEKEPMGILPILNDESVFPDADDTTLTRKLHKQHELHRNFRKPRFEDNTFKVLHYAGEVEYQTADWLEKNRDPLEKDLQDLMSGSRLPFVRSLFDPKLAPANNAGAQAAQKADAAPAGRGGRSPSGIGRSRKGGTNINTVAVQYKDQLTNLMEMLRATNPHFIRCILPNLQQKPGFVNDYTVLEQLKCNGVLEGIRIARKGWPNRIKYAEFNKRYYLLKPGADSRAANAKESVKDIVNHLTKTYPEKVKSEAIRFGLTKIFFRAGQMALIEQLREELISKMIISIQAASRAFLARREFNKGREQDLAAKTLQRNIRVWLELQEWPWWQLYRLALPNINRRNFTKEIKELEDRIRKLEKERDALKASYDALVKERDAVESDVSAAEKDLSALKNSIQDLEDEKADLKSEKDSLEKKAKALEEDLSDEAKATDALMKEKNELQKKRATLEASLKDEKEQAAKLEEDKRKVEQERDSWNEKFEDEQLKAQALNKKIDDLTHDLSTAKSDFDEANATADSLRNKLKNVEKNLAAAADELSKTSAERAVADKSKRDIGSEIETARKNLEETKAARDKAAEAVKRTQQQIDELNGQLEEERGKVARSEKASKDLKSAISGLEDQLEEAAVNKTNIEKAKAALTAKADELEAAAKSSESGKSATLDEVKRLRTSLEESRRKLEESEANLNRLRAEKKTLADELVTIEEQIEAAREEGKKDKKKLQKKIQDLQNNINDKPRGGASSEELKKLQVQISELVEDLMVSEGSRSTAERLASQKSIELDDLRNKLEDAKRTNTRESAKNKKLKNDLEENTTQLEAEITTTNALSGNNKKLVDELDDLRRKLASVEKSRGPEQVENFKRENASLKKELTDIDRENRALERDVSQVKTRLDDAIAQLTLERQGKQRLTDQSNELKKALVETERANHENITKLQAENDKQRIELEHQIQDLEETNKTLVAQLGQLEGDEGLRSSIRSGAFNSPTPSRD